MTKPHVGGAPLTRFTPSRVKAILADIKNGIPYSIAAEKNFIHHKTFDLWRNIGLEDIKKGEINTEYAKLIGALRTIEADRILENLSQIRADPKSHRGCEWDLERSFWRHYSSKVVEIEVNERLEKLEGDKNEEMDSISNQE